MSKLVLLLLVCACMLTGCSVSIPSADQFTVAAMGTPFPSDTPLESLILPVDSSGVMFANRTGRAVRIAIEETFADIPAGQSFLFVVPPGSHLFYIYEFGANPKAHSEWTEAGKVRYVYLLPIE